MKYCFFDHNLWTHLISVDYYCCSCSEESSQFFLHLFQNINRTLEEMGVKLAIDKSIVMVEGNTRRDNYGNFKIFIYYDQKLTLLYYVPGRKKKKCRNQTDVSLTTLYSVYFAE